MILTCKISATGEDKDIVNATVDLKRKASLGFVWYVFINYILRNPVVIHWESDREEFNIINKD